MPAVDIIEAKDELLLQADVPGATAENIDVNYEKGVLTVHAVVAERQSKETNYIQREYGVGDFHRSFRVGDGVDATGISAEMSSGVLTLHLPKAAAARQRKIEVASG
ncbi:MAG: Hsp20/alpha crystallin family protein [Planctomycetes bacterium]|nr:Hsp20/alpha crystallin family protein [Planctomycetota bacterium]